ncbi:MAG: Zn(2+)-responsive transcriptional regulator [Calditrichaeota bacterium]|nr:MAG: Zn(2+)-responsive transcriptional regulator [Calditrichota bacterium]
MEYTIGKLAARAGVNIDTIRFYERQGLMPEPRRRESGYRLYSDEDLKRLRFILRAKELGFTLREIRDLLELRVDGETGCEDVRRQAEAKIALIDQKIARLRQVREALSRLAQACRASSPAGECPILHYLEIEQFHAEN